MTPKIRSVGRGPAGRRYLSSDRELRLGVCFWFRLFNVVPETTARFFYLDDRSRNQSPPCMGTPLIDLIRSAILGDRRPRADAYGWRATRRSSVPSPWKPAPPPARRPWP